MCARRVLGGGHSRKTHRCTKIHISVTDYDTGPDWESWREGWVHIITSTINASNPKKEIPPAVRWIVLRRLQLESIWREMEAVHHFLDLDQESRREDKHVSWKPPNTSNWSMHSERRQHHAPWRLLRHQRAPSIPGPLRYNRGFGRLHGRKRKVGRIHNNFPPRVVRCMFPGRRQHQLHAWMSTNISCKP